MSKCDSISYWFDMIIDNLNYWIKCMFCIHLNLEILNLEITIKELDISKINQIYIDSNKEKI